MDLTDMIIITAILIIVVGFGLSGGGGGVVQNDKPTTPRPADPPKAFNPTNVKKRIIR